MKRVIYLHIVSTCCVSLLPNTNKKCLFSSRVSSLDAPNKSWDVPPEYESIEADRDIVQAMSLADFSDLKFKLSRLLT